MKRKGIALVALVTALGSAAPSPAHADFIFEGERPFGSVLGAWYTPWWEPSDPAPAVNWKYTRYVPYGKNASGRVVLAHYDQSVAETRQYQLDLMEQTGIGFLLMDFTNGSGHGKSVPNAVALQAANRVKVNAAIGGALWQNEGLSRAEAARQTQEEADIVWNELVKGKTNYLKFPAYTDGVTRPLLVTFLNYDHGKSNVLLTDWYDDRFTIQRATGVLDPANPGVDLKANGYQWDSWWGWHTRTTFYSKTCMTVSPGYDTTHFPTGSGLQMGRNDGLTYMTQWIEAIKANPKAIVITSWNDFNEENHIEPCEPTGNAPRWNDPNGNQTSDLYLKITRAYAALRERRLLEGFYYRDQQGSGIYRVCGKELLPITRKAEIAPNHPIVILPDDWLTQIRKTNRIIRER